MRGYRFHPSALAEFEEAVEHYLQLSPEAASRFVDEFEAAVAFVQQNPTAPARVKGNARRWNLRRFPYALIYRVVDNRLVLLAVMHAHRDPSYWTTRRV